jgi:integrase
MPRPVAAMVQVQLLTGCRTSEVLTMRVGDLDRTEPVWVYTPRWHKNHWRGQRRVIYLGPQAQVIVSEFLKADPDAYLFCPREYVEAARARRAERRKSKRTPSEMARVRKARPGRQPGLNYNRRSFRLAINRACRKAAVPPWSPLSLRHAAATAIRAKFGVEAAQVVLGHARCDVTQLYAEKNLGLARRVAAEVG